MDEVEKLIRLLMDSDNMGARAAAAHNLGMIRDRRAVPALIEALKNDAHMKARRDAAWALGTISDASAVPALIEALKDENTEVKIFVAWALGIIGDPSGVQGLMETLKDKDEDLQENAADALGKIVKKCETIKELEKVEKGVDEGSVALRKGSSDKTILINAQIEIAKLTSLIAEKKDKLAPKKDLLLDDKPKPPKKGRKVYRAFTTLRV